MTDRFHLRFFRRVATMLALAVVGALVFIGGPSGTSQPAHAVLGMDFCPGFLKDDDAPDPAGFKSGVEAMLPSMSPAGRLAGAMSPDEKAYGSTKPVTALEQFGSTGLQWTRYDEDCSVWGPAKNMIANQFFGFSTALTSITIGMYTWATDPNLLDSFMEPVGCVVKGCNGSQGLDDALYLNFLTPVIVLGALWAGYTGLVKKSTTQAWQGGLWMIMSAGFALFFMANPTGIAQMGNSFVSNANAITASAVTSATSSATEKSDICFLPDGAKDYGPRVSACSIWKALAYSPWSTGQFGVSDAQPLTDKKVGTKCTFSGKAWKDMRVTQLCATSWTHDEAPYSAVLGGGLVTDAVSKDTGQMSADDKKGIWKDIKDQLGKDSTWAGKDPGARINIAFAAIIANMAAGLIILIISFSNVVLALGMILLIMGAPVFLLIGAHPGVGRGIALKWLELLLSTVVKRVVLGFMLALLIGMYQIIISTDMASLSKVALIMAVGVAAMIYRKPMLEALNVINLGGTQTGIEQGGPQAAQKAGNMGVGAVAGGLAAAVAGGGVGAVLGSAARGTMASRAGMNPAVQAGRMAGAQGARRGERSAAARAARRPGADGGQDVNCTRCGKPIPDGSSDCTNPSCPSNKGSGSGGGRVPRPGGGAVPTPTPVPAPAPKACPECGTSMNIVGSGNSAAYWCPNSPNHNTGGGTSGPSGGRGGTPAPTGGGGATPHPSGGGGGGTPHPSGGTNPTNGSPVSGASPAGQTTPAPAAGQSSLPTRPGTAPHDPGGLDVAREITQATVGAQRRSGGGSNPPPPAR